MDHKKIIAVIVAAGKGVRFDNLLPKQYYSLYNKMIIEYSLDLLSKNPFVDGILLVINEEHKHYYNNIISKYNLINAIFGGPTRADSIKNAIHYLKEYAPDYVLIHDACRPLISENFINCLIANIADDNCCICPALPITETIKEINANEVSNIDRTNKYIIQTPQIIKFDTYYKIFNENTIQIANYTDDSSIISALGFKVKYVEGEKVNIKITNKSDIEFAKKMLERKQFKTGLGFDTHKFGIEDSTNNFIILGGVKIPYNKSIIAHSDGDVLIHALVDAMLGALGMGDIGEHFPDNNPKWQDQDSTNFLRHACSLLAQKNASISNIDIIIVCEAPKILPYKKQIKINLSNIIKIDAEQVNIKATTTEKMGFIGRGEGIAVYATVTISV